MTDTPEDEPRTEQEPAAPASEPDEPQPAAEAPVEPAAEAPAEPEAEEAQPEPDARARG